MRNLMLAVLLFAVPAMADTYVDEHTTIMDNGVVKVGPGINKEVSPGVWVQASKTIKSDAQTYYNDEIETSWSLRKNNGDITLNRGGQASTLAFAGLYWFEEESQQFVKIADPTISLSQSGDSLILSGMYPGVDVAVNSEYSGISIVTTITDMTGWPSHSFTGTVWLAFYHEIKSTGHTIKADENPWDGVTKVNPVEIKFEGDNGSHFIVQGSSVESADSAYILSTNILMQGPGAKDYFATGIPEYFLDGVILPIRMGK